MHMIPVPKCGRMTGEFYAENCVREVEKFDKKRRPCTGARGIKLLHDNARPHMSKIVRETMEYNGFEVIDHPPYWPDLPPCDIWLFQELKTFRGTAFRYVTRHGNGDLPLPQFYLQRTV